MRKHIRDTPQLKVRIRDRKSGMPVNQRDDFVNQNDCMQNHSFPSTASLPGFAALHHYTDC